MHFPTEHSPKPAETLSPPPGASPKPMSDKLCLVGCGWFSNHFYGLAIRELVAAHPAAEFAACCDIVEERARSFRETFGARNHYTDLGTMLECERPAAVLLAVPPSITHEAATLVLERNIPLLIEKPPGLTIAQWTGLTALAARRGTPTQIAFNRRYMPALIHARDILQKAFPPEDISQIKYEMIRHSRLSEDFSTTAIHALDTLLFLTRSALREARLSFSAAATRQPCRITLDATTVSGINVRLDILPGAGRISERISIHAIGQSMEINIIASPQGMPHGSVVHWRNGDLVNSHADNKTSPLIQSGVYPEVAAFYTSVCLDRQPPTPSLAECYQQVALMEAIRNRCSTPISFPEQKSADRSG